MLLMTLYFILCNRYALFSWTLRFNTKWHLAICTVTFLVSKYSLSLQVSSDLGLIHLVGLDLNNFDPDQMAWLEKDLAAANANRENVTHRYRKHLEERLCFICQVPWIMVTSHFPLHYSKFEENKGASAEYYLGDEAESLLIPDQIMHLINFCFLQVFNLRT